MRLLSLLQLVEGCLVHLAPSMVTVPTRRQANYTAGRARLLCSDGSSLLLHAFPLADGQLCIKATGYDAKADPVIEHVIYASAPGFVWMRAAEELAELWVAALEAQAARDSEIRSTPDAATAEAADADDELAATG